MAKEIKMVIIDMEYPDDLVDSETSNPTRLANFTRELTKIIRDGCAVNGYDSNLISASSLLHVSYAEVIFELEQQ